VHEQPVARRRRAGGDHRVHHVHAREIDDAGPNAERIGDRLVLRDDIPSCGHGGQHDSVRVGTRRKMCDLRIVDWKRRRFAQLPAHQLIQITGTRRQFLKSNQRDTSDAVRDHQRRTAG
jgi:hypothetical protein